MHHLAQANLQHCRSASVEWLIAHVGKEFAEFNRLRRIVAKEVTSCFDYVTEQLNLQTLRKLNRLPSVDAMSIVKPLVKTFHRDGTRPLLRRNLVRIPDA